MFNGADQSCSVIYHDDTVLVSAVDSSDDGKVMRIMASRTGEKQREAKLLYP